MTLMFLCKMLRSRKGLHIYKSHKNFRHTSNATLVTHCLAKTEAILSRIYLVSVRMLQRYVRESCGALPTRNLNSFTPSSNWHSSERCANLCSESIFHAPARFAATASALRAGLRTCRRSDLANRMFRIS